VAIGVEVGGEPSVGVVFDTGRDVPYAAERGGPATANGEQIRAGAKADVDAAMVATGFSFDPGLRIEQAEELARLMGGIRDVRRSGAASIDLCALAAGAVDADRHGRGPRARFGSVATTRAAEGVGPAAVRPPRFSTARSGRSRDHHLPCGRYQAGEALRTRGST
jgi:inositol monophosphatase family protein